MSRRFFDARPIRLTTDHMGGLEGPPKPPQRSARPGKAVARLDPAQSGAASIAASIASIIVSC
jgi:hypothetical protein